MVTDNTLHLRIKKHYAADVIMDLQKMNAIEFVKQPNVKKKPVIKNSHAIPDGKSLTAKELKLLLLESETQPTTSLETIKKQWEKRRKQLMK